jgi:hypothetical protein
MNIKGVDRGELVAALYNASTPQGMGMLHYDPRPMTKEEGATLVGQYLDYVKGRIMKIEIPVEGMGDEVHTALYNRDNGMGAAENVLCLLSGAETKA